MSASKLAVLATKLVTSSIVSRPAPTFFYYPGLSSYPFHDPDQFSFAEKLKVNIKVIQHEFTELKQVYKVNNYDPEKREQSLLQGTMQWITFWYLGKPNDTVHKLCPKTAKLLETIPELITNTPFGRSYFLSLNPNSSLKPHHGPTKVRLRCHLPIRVPGEGFLRVGGKLGEWEEGKLLIFDESFAHEQVNLDESKDKDILVFDIWHPDLTKEERELFAKGYHQFLKKHKEDKKKS